MTARSGHIVATRLSNTALSGESGGEPSVTSLGFNDSMVDQLLTGHHGATELGEWRCVPLRSGITSRILTRSTNNDNRWLLMRVVVPGLLGIALAAGVLFSPLGRGLSDGLPAVLTFIGVLVTSARPLLASPCSVRPSAGSPRSTIRRRSASLWRDMNRTAALNWTQRCARAS